MPAVPVREIDITMLLRVVTMKPYSNVYLNTKGFVVQMESLPELSVRLKLSDFL